MRSPASMAWAMPAFLAGFAPASSFASGNAYGPKGLGQNNDVGPPALQEVAVVEHLGERVPGDIRFVDASGKPGTLAERLALGKPLLVTLGYYRCPMLCDLVDKGLVKAMQGMDLKLGRDFNVVTISIDPEETPMQASNQQVQTLRTLSHDGPREDWTFGVARADDIKKLAEAVGFRYGYDPNTKQYAHAAVAFVLTPEGVISRYLYGIEFGSRDVKLAIVEAAGGRVGTSLDRAILSCFKWDPALRKYGFYAWALFKIGGGLILAAVVTLMSVLWWRELRMRKGAAA